MKYQELKELVKRHDYLYYKLAKPEISDEEYNLLYDLLVQLEEQQGWSDPDSPVGNVGGSIKGKIKHPYKLYSLNKVYDISDVDPEFDVKTPKLDGANISLIYDRGYFIRAATRGDGEFGEDITHLITSIPFSRHFPNIGGTVVICAECVTFKKVENYRNYVAGAINLKDRIEFQSRHIDFIVHDVLGFPQTDYIDRLKWAQEVHGFKTVLQEEYTSQIPQDGVVYRINEVAHCNELGYTSKYPRFAVALKPEQEKKLATILDVEWNIGRSGRVTPKAIITPTILDDAVITRATLHNMDFIDSHKLHIGDKVLIERAGGIIPSILKRISTSGGVKIDQELAEGYLNKELSREGPWLLASHVNWQKITEHFVKVMDIKGLGEKSLDKMDITHPSELYRDNDWDILGANGEKIILEIEKSKSKPYYQVLAALAIPGVGESTAKLISQYIPSFAKLKTIKTNTIMGIGPKTVQSIREWLEENEEWVLALPVQLEGTYQSPTTIKKVCITGKLDMSRDALKNLLQDKGYLVKDAVTKDCYALICDGESTSSKFKKAKELGVRIVNYSDYKTMILSGNL